MWKKYLLRISLFLIACFVIFFAFIWLNKDNLIADGIKTLNSKLDAKVEVNGTIDITFFSTFPSVTLELKEVFIADKLNAKDTLASLAKVNLTVNPFSLLKSTKKFESIGLKNGMLKLKTFKDGKSNFDIVKKNDNIDSTQNVSLALEQILLENVDVEYNDLKNKIFVDTYIYDASASGKFYNKDFLLTIELDTKTEMLNISGTYFLNNNLLNASVRLDYKDEGKCISFMDNKIDIDNNKFELDGAICVEENTINLTANSSGKKLENALKLVPKDLFQLEGIVGNGAYDIEVKLNQKLNKPKIIVNFSLEDAEANIEKLNIDLEDLHATGTYSNVPKNNIVIKDFAFKSGASQVNGNIFLPNLKEKNMQMKLDGAIHTEQINQLGLKHVKFDQEGVIDLNNLNFNFNLRPKDSVWIASKLTGDIDFKNIKGRFDKINQDFSLDGNLNAVGKKINVKNLSFTIGKNNISFSGSLLNALNYFQDNLFKTNAPLEIYGKISSSYFNINSFLDENDSQETGEIPSLLKWLNIAAKVDLNIEKLKYKKLELHDLTAKIKSNKAGTFNIVNASVAALDGKARGNVELRFFNDKTLEVSLDSKLNNIDLNKLFIAFDNFEQKTIRNNNIKGMVNCNLLVAMSFKNFVQFQENDLLVQSDFTIKNGELIELDALKSLSKYLSIEQLEHIYFSEYSASMSIVNRLLKLNKSKIKSNIISLDFGGTHSFDNQIDYIIKLNLRNILAAKFKKKKTLNKDYVNDIGGGINLFISMKGSIQDPIIKFEKRKVFFDEKKNEKSNSKEEIKNMFKQDTSTQSTKKEFYFDDEEEEFIEFEE